MHVLQGLVAGPWGTWLAGLLGLFVGSFTNVVIHRTPREGLSVRRPARSFCPACSRTIPWHDNVPVVSWLILRGRCRACRAPIGWRYPLVELLVALLFVAAWRLFPPLDVAGATRLFAAWFLAAACVAVTAIDLEHTIIPDAITKPGFVVGALASLAFPALHEDHLGFQPEAPHVSSLVMALAGALAGGGSLWLVGRLGNLVLRRRVREAGLDDAMGWGDVKWMTMCGTLLGPALVLDAILIACVLGALAGLLLRLVASVRRASSPAGLPFGPFLSMGVLCELVEPALAWQALARLSSPA